jgi:hypothetical protein
MYLQRGMYAPHPREEAQQQQDIYLSVFAICEVVGFAEGYVSLILSMVQF